VVLKQKKSRTSHGKPCPYKHGCELLNKGPKARKRGATEGWPRFSLHDSFKEIPISPREIGILLGEIHISLGEIYKSKKEVCISLREIHKSGNGLCKSLPDFTIRRGY